MNAAAAHAEINLEEMSSLRPRKNSPPRLSNGLSKEAFSLSSAASASDAPLNGRDFNSSFHLLLASRHYTKIELPASSRRIIRAADSNNYSAGKRCRAASKQSWPIALKNVRGPANRAGLRSKWPYDPLRLPSYLHLFFATEHCKAHTFLPILQVGEGSMNDFIRKFLSRAGFLRSLPATILVDNHRLAFTFGWSRISHLLPLVLIPIGLLGCAQGAAEFQLYAKAFDGQYEQAQRVFDAMARAERVVVKRNLASNEFQPALAAYYLDNVDPPVTSSIRNSLRSLKNYNDALAALQNGEAANALLNRVGTITTNVVAAIASTQVALGGPAAQIGATKLIGDSDSLLKAVLPILQPLVTAASREAFRQQLVVAYPSMKGLVVTLRDNTPVIFALFKRSHQNIDERRPSKEALLAIEKDREMLAGWVLLLDQTLITMEAAVTAAMSDASSNELAVLAEASVDLKVLAEKVKSLRLK